MTSSINRLAVLAAVLTLTLTGCTGGNVETRTEDEAKQLVQQRRDQVATLVGSTAFTQNTESPGPCEGKLGETNRDVFSVQGAYMLPLPPARQLDTLARIRETWKADGYEITEDRVFDQNSGVLRAEAPDGFSIRLVSSRDQTSVGILIHSPCYRSPSPR